MSDQTALVALKSCPFCGGDDLRVAYLRAAEDLRFWRVECADAACDAGTLGPSADTEEQAVSAWNRRALQSSPSESDVAAGWQPIETAPKDEEIVGLKAQAVGVAPTISGRLYDLVPGAVIDRWSGRWAVCSHWTAVPRTLSQGGRAEEVGA
jgi:Lar family restriction alleviation protein